MKGLSTTSRNMEKRIPGQSSGGWKRPVGDTLKDELKTAENRTGNIQMDNCLHKSWQPLWLHRDVASANSSDSLTKAGTDQDQRRRRTR